MIKPILSFLLVFYLPTLKANEITPWNMSQTSQNNHYQVDLLCDHPPTLNSFQACALTLTNNSKPLSDVNIIIEGGMPEHHHGLPTTPKVSWDNDKKLHTINGLKFSMPGAWQLTFLIDKTKYLPRDIATINFNIN